MTYSYYNLFGFSLKLNYHNLWFITFGFCIFFCLENMLLTIIYIHNYNQKAIPPWMTKVVLYRGLRLVI